MSDQSKLGLGKIITTTQNRDAIHISIAPIIAAHTLIAGRHVGLDQHGHATEHTGSQIGIVDPFLKVTIEKGQQFWLFLYPGTITSLRHEWAHPAFGAEEKAIVDKEESEKWVRAYVKKNCPYYDDECIRRMYPTDSMRDGYEEFMLRVRDGEIFYYGSDLHSIGELEDAKELFGHLSILLGHPVGVESFTYSCSC